MRTTRGRWVMQLLQSFDFIKSKVKKHMSSSTSPTICAITNSTNFTYSRKFNANVQNVVTRHHILIEGLVSKGGTIHVVAFNFIVNFEHVLLIIKVINIQHLGNLCFMTVNDFNFFIVRCNFHNYKVLANDASHFDYSQY